jgi:hypothetical protein
MLLAVALLLAAAACGGREAAPADVVRAWADALRAEDNERAASLFAPGAAIVQADRLIRLRNHHAAVVWNSRLPCSGTIVALSRDGSAVTATFRLGDRKRSACDGPPGAEAVAVIVVEHGKIVLWDQIESRFAVGH